MSHAPIAPGVVNGIREALQQRGLTLDSLSHDRQAAFAGKMGVDLPALHAALASQAPPAPPTLRGVGRSLRDRKVWRAVEAVEFHYRLSTSGERWERFDRALRTLEGIRVRGVEQPNTVEDGAFRTARQLRHELDGALADYKDRLVGLTASRGAVQAQRQAAKAAAR